jgi:excisionase family DNA binding protein
MIKKRRICDSPTVPSPWLRPEDAADYLGVSLGTLRNWTSARYIPFARRGRVVRYHRHSLDDWLYLDACPGRSSIADVVAAASEPATPKHAQAACRSPLLSH